MRSKRAANSSSSRTIFSLLSLVLFLLLLGGGGGIVVVSVSSSFRTEDIYGVCARERACLCRACSALCLSLLCYLFCFVTSRKQTNLRDENAKNEKRERERDRERTQSEIDYYCSRGLSASLEIFFFFFNSQSHWKRRSFFCHAATLRSLSWKTFLTLSSGLKFVVLLSFSRTREFPRPFHLEQLLSALLSAREI